MLFRPTLVALAYLLFFHSTSAKNADQPNVIIIMTDDQGYGDLGFTGNPHVKTPTIDGMAKKSIRFNNFYVSPVCAPTRASLMTGRHSLRTGIRDTYNGGAMMATEEVTIAEVLKSAGYTTGVFGKWHLGDNYPSRPSDQGFDESLIHLSGGMGQVGDITTYFKGNTSYFDPVLWHNNKKEAYEGYCSDIFTSGAIDFIEQNSNSPFLCYLAFNAPHTPLQVPDEYYEQYKDIDPSEGFEDLPEMSEKDKEDARKVYAMVTNIDDNLARLFDKLDELKIADNTVVIFMTDNGPQQRRYVAGMRGRKGNVYQGGIRVPFYMNVPRSVTKKNNKDIDQPAAHIDLMPTLAELCQAQLPTDRTIDGKSLLPLLKDQQVDWPDRSLFFYWTRKYPELYNNMALQRNGYKLVAKTDYNASIDQFELYNLNTDPFEKNNLVSSHTSQANMLKSELDALYTELITSENLIHQPLIKVGRPEENPIYLNRNDAGGERGIWNQEEIHGKWAVDVAEGVYTIRFRFIKPISAGGKMYLEAGAQVNQMINKEDGIETLEMKDVSLQAFQGDLIPFYAVQGRKIFPFWVEMEKQAE